MWARQAAWLQSPVKGADGNATATTRAQQIESDGGTVRLPEVQAAHLVSTLQGAGICMAGGMSASPLTATELTAWCSGTGSTLAPWEFAAVLTASRAYVSQMHTDSIVPPFGSAKDLSDPATLSQKMARSFASLARPVKSKRPSHPSH